MNDVPWDSSVPPGNAVELDVLYSALADGHRRQVLRHLRNREDAVASVDNLVDHVVNQDGLANDRDRIELTLCHRSLPTLADAGFLEYDVRSRTVRYRETPLLSEAIGLLSVTETVTNHSCGDGPSR